MARALLMTAHDSLRMSQDFSNPYLLSYYGFAIEDNMHDVLPISLSFPGGAKAPGASSRKRFLKALNLTLSQQLSATGVSISLLNLVRHESPPCCTLLPACAHISGCLSS